jgi:hypothetical protein
VVYLSTGEKNGRKKWEKNWNEVKYCSEKCRKNKSKILNKL